MRVLADESFGHFEVPAKLAVLHLKVDRQWYEKSARHGVDEGRTFLDRLCLGPHCRIETLLRQQLEPVGQTEHRRNWPRQNRVEFARAAKPQRHLIDLVHDCLPVCQRTNSENSDDATCLECT